MISSFYFGQYFKKWPIFSERNQHYKLFNQPYMEVKHKNSSFFLGEHLGWALQVRIGLCGQLLGCQSVSFLLFIDDQSISFNHERRKMPGSSFFTTHGAGKSKWVGERYSWRNNFIEMMWYTADGEWQKNKGKTLLYLLGSYFAWPNEHLLPTSPLPTIPRCIAGGSSEGDWFKSGSSREMCTVWKPAQKQNGSDLTLRFRCVQLSTSHNIWHQTLVLAKLGLQTHWDWSEGSFCSH